MTFIHRRKRPLKLILQAISGDLPGAFETVTDALSEHDPAHSAETRARLWRYEALVLCLEEILIVINQQHQLTDIDTDTSIKLRNTLDTIEKTHADDVLRIEDITDPTGSAYYKTAFQAISKYLSALQAPAFPELQSLAYRSYLSGISRAYQNDPEYFNTALLLIQGPHTQGIHRQLQLRRHAESIRNRFNEKPLWGQERTTRASLRDLYVPLRCISFQLPDGNDQDAMTSTEHNRDSYIGEVDDLDARVRGWLQTDDQRDWVQIITGGPGSGKSSFVRSFITGLIERPLESHIWHPILIEAQRLRRLEELENEIGDLLRRDTDSGFDENPFSWTPFPFDKDRRLLLIFDGLDEVGAPGEQDTERLRKLVGGANEIARTRGGDAGFVKVLLLGRPSAAKNARNEAALGIERITETLPLVPITHKVVGLNKGNLRGPKQLCHKDYRPVYWNKWVSIGDLQSDNACPLLHPGFGELTAEPVLCYLLILSGRTTKNNISEAANNKNYIYEDILANLLPRNWGDRSHPSTEGLTKDDFFFLQECLGLATWAHGGRVGDPKLFADIRDLAAMGSKRLRLQRLPAADLRSVATSFYTRDEEGYEFVHKSFADYLIARGLWRFVRDRLLPIIDSNGFDDTLYYWLRLTGLAPISEDILHFILGEIKKENIKAVAETRNMVNDLLKIAIDVGIPAHRIPGEEGFKWRVSAAENAEGALIMILCLCYFESEEKLRIAARYQRKILDMLQVFGLIFNISGRISVEYRDFIYRRGGVSLEHLNLTGQDLSGLKVSHCRFSGSVMCEADCSHSIMQFCSFIHTNLTDANFASADLSNSNFIGADLTNANFSDSNIDNAALPYNWKSIVKFEKGREPKGKPVLMNKKAVNVALR